MVPKKLADTILSIAGVLTLRESPWRCELPGPGNDSNYGCEAAKLWEAHDLLSVSQSAEMRAVYDTMDNENRNLRKLECVSDLFGGAARKTPLLLIVEDLHWYMAAPSIILQA